MGGLEDIAPIQREERERVPAPSPDPNPIEQRAALPVGSGGAEKIQDIELRPMPEKNPLAQAAQA